MEVRERLGTLPRQPGVYIFHGADGKILYVGKARSLRERVRSYFQAQRPLDPRKQSLVREIADLELIVTDSEVEAIALENNLIKSHHPPYNVLLRDDKNHPYLKLTLGEKYPRLHIVRRVTGDGSAYGGPYIPASLARRTAAVVHKVFGVRSCREKLDGRRPRPCLQHQIGRCLAPCVEELCGLQDYKSVCGEARLFLEGRDQEVVDRLRRRMTAASEDERFEEAARLRDQIRILEQLDAPQKISTAELRERDVFGAYVEGERAALQVFSVRGGRVVGRDAFLLDRLTDPENVVAEALQQYYASGRHVPPEILVQNEIAEGRILEEWLTKRRGGRVRIRAPRRGEKVRLLELVAKNARLAFELEWKHPKRQTEETLRALRDLLALPSEPRRIECFDVSNIQGSDVVASMVCFEDARPCKSDYRKYRIRCVAGAPDDFAAMRETVGRRFRRLIEESREPPDLVIVDGGLGQLAAAESALIDLGLGHQPMAGIAKREELLYVPGRNAPIALSRHSPVLQFVQRMRDEAHRFAIGFHRKTRSRRTLRSELDEIPGIGPKRRKRLLERFGSLRGVREASQEQLAAVVGAALAKMILSCLGPDSASSPVDKKGRREPDQDSRRRE